MSRKQITIVVVMVLVASIVSALVAYRHGARRASTPVVASPPSAADIAEISGPCVEIGVAGSLIGKPGCVAGRVLKVYTSGAENTFLDFCEDYRTCPFAAVVFSADRGKFGDLSTLSGRLVEIRGPVVTYRNRAEIVIHDPEQISVVP